MTSSSGGTALNDGLLSIAFGAFGAAFVDFGMECQRGSGRIPSLAGTW